MRAQWTMGPWSRMPGGTLRRGLARRSLLRGLPGYVLVLFIALKLTGVIDWPWWYVLSPAWLPLLALLALGVLAAAGFTLVRWFLLARAWVRFRRSLLPELALADPVIWSRIQAERPGAGSPSVGLPAIELGDAAEPAPEGT
jgi:hypothetical protein